MNLQYISDSNGQTTGVFIPINEWNDLKKKYLDIEREDIDIPEWHKSLVRQRLDNFKNNANSALDFDTAMTDIENEL
jgi:hypothetical protein